jgi:hypothetical protein
MSQAQAQQPLQVFLCHAKEDKSEVRKLYQRLRADGIEPWLDEENLLPGQDWHREIQRAIQATDIVVVCLSQRSVSKVGYVQREMRFALDKADEQPEGTIFIIPTRLEECSVPDRLRYWHWVDLFIEGGYTRLIRALIQRATELGRTIPPVPTQAPNIEEASEDRQRPIDYYSVFISYSNKDAALAERLYADLQAQGVRCWYAPHGMQIGEPILSGIDWGIRLHDKLLLIVSESSVESGWVEQEVYLALARERIERRRVLFPIRIDDTVLESRQGWPAVVQDTINIGDFRQWKDHFAYQVAFARLLRDLKAEQR